MLSSQVSTGPATGPTSPTSRRRALRCVSSKRFTTGVICSAIGAALLLIGCSGGVPRPDPKPVPVIRIEDTRIAEFDNGATKAEFMVVLTPASEQFVTVDYATADVTAEAEKDYTATSGTLTFSPGETTKTINVAITDDPLVEPDETFTVTLSSPSNATLADTTAVGTIVNDDTYPMASITDTRIPESDNGATTTAEFTVTLTRDSEQVATVDYATADVTAEAGKDYTAASGTLTFSPGETTKMISVSITDDPLVEPYETFTVTLSSPSNTTLADAMATGTVTNDDTKIYYVANGWESEAPTRIMRANLDGTELEALTPDLGVDVRGLALDIAGGSDKVYWTVYWPDGEEKIQRANLDGTDVETVLIPDCNPWGIALDAAGGKMYWIGCGIWRANLDGSNSEHLVAADEVDSGTPIGIALDLAGGKMYWTDRGDDRTGPGKIQRANLDGSAVEDVIVDARSPHPHALVLDPSAGKVYWSSRDAPRGRFQIFRASLDGSDIEELVSEGVDTPVSMALDIDEGKMYWTDWGGKVQRADLDGTDVEDLVTEPGSFPDGIALALR